MNLLGVLLPNCREMARTSSRRLDGALPVAQRVGRAIHLAFCRHCRRYRRQIEWIRETALTSKAHLETAPASSQALRQRLKGRLCDPGTASQSTVKPPEIPTQPIPSNPDPTTNPNE